MMWKRARPPGHAAALTALGLLAGGAGAGAAPAQELPAGVEVDTVRLGALAAVEPVAWRGLAAGEQVLTWVAEPARVGNPGAPGPPVPDAPPGAVLASFGGSPLFAWPDRPTVWTAPSEGELAFALNAWPVHEVQQPAEVVVVPLGPSGSEPHRAFDPPAIELERVPGGVVARYADHAGFGLVPRALRLTVTTSHGTTYHLGVWAVPGESETFLPLPPPGIPLPPGVHTLSATIEDRLGNTAPPATILFDALQPSADSVQ